MGRQRELRWHKPEWHVAPVRPVREPTRAHRRNPNADTNCKSNANGYRDGYSNRNGYTDRNCNGHANSDTDRHSYAYSYGDSKANTDSERCAHTKASPDPAAASVTGNSRPRKFKNNRTN